MDYIKQLTELQQQIGYRAGNIEPVAFLGLLGEVGEVAAEVYVSARNELISEVEGLSMLEREIYQKKHMLRFYAAEVDALKKEVRKDSAYSNGLVVEIANEEDFKLELADVFYYLNAIASCMGMTLNDLAKLSYEKVMAKRATIGPEILSNPESN